MPTLSTKKIHATIPQAVEKMFGEAKPETVRRARISHSHVAGKPGTRDRWYTSAEEISRSKYRDVLGAAATLSAGDAAPVQANLTTLDEHGEKHLMHPSTRAMVEAMQDRRPDLRVSYMPESAEQYITSRGLEHLRPEISGTQEEHFRGVQNFLHYDMDVSLDQVRSGTIDFSGTDDPTIWEDFGYDVAPTVIEIRDANDTHVGTVLQWETQEVTETSWLRLYMDPASGQFLNRVSESTA